MSNETKSTWFDWAAEHLETWKTSRTGWRNLFTSDAFSAVQNASHAARSLNHNCVGAEHLLAGLLKAICGSVPAFLNASGLDLLALRKEIEAVRFEGPTEGAARPAPYTPRFSRIIEAARDEARVRGHAQIDTPHLLLGLLRERDGLATDILKKFHIDADNARLVLFPGIGH